MNTFSQKLRSLREAHGLSLRKMAVELTALGEPTSHAAIAKWEAFDGEDASRLPKRSAIAAIAKLFNVKPGWLLEDVFDIKAQKTDRESKLSDIDLLSDTEFELVIAIKNQFLKSRKRDERDAAPRPVD